MNDDPSTPDRLAVATDALRQLPIPDDLSPDLIRRAEQIPSTARTLRSPIRPKLLAAVAIAILLFGGLALFFLGRSTDIALADVVDNVNRTHTFTAQVRDWYLYGPIHSGNCFARGQDIRFETGTLVRITNHQTGKTLVLDKEKHVAYLSAEQPDARLDLYSLLRNYGAPTQQSLGEQKIDGHSVQIFRTKSVSPHSDWDIFWVDKSTKLPVRVSMGFEEFNDLHFDVPLDDALFDTKVPTGYTLAPSQLNDPWQQFNLAGHIVDDQGKPVPGVDIIAGVDDIEVRAGTSLVSVSDTTTDKDGRFILEGLHIPGEDPICLEFWHPDFLYARVGDLRRLSPDARSNLWIQLSRGQSVSGQVVDEAGRPVAQAAVRSILDPTIRKEPGNGEVEYEYTKFTGTDDQGHFTLRGLPSAMFRLQVQKASPGAAFLSAQSKPFFLPTTRPATLTLTAKPLAMPPAAAIHQLFGMKLVDMDDSLRTMLSRGPGEAVMILDPGLHADRLNIGAPHVGDAFWMVGMTRIKNFRDFAQQLLTACQEQQKKGSTDFFVRVVYDYTASDNHFRSNTQLMHLTPADMAELQKAVQP